MRIEELRNNLRRLKELRDEIIMSNSKSRFGCTLFEYFVRIRESIIYVDHGEGDLFFIPKHRASLKLDELMDINVKEFNSAYSKNKTKLLSIVNRYLKDITHAIETYELS